MPDESATRGERTRSDILQTAHKLFLNNGFHGTSMRQIADEAGIAVGGIYNHFSNKEDVFVAVLEANHPFFEFLPALRNAEGSTVEEYVRSAARSMLASLDHRPDLLNIMFIEIVEFNSKHIPHFFSKFFPQFLEIVQAFTSRQASLRPVPVPILLRAFFGLFFSYYITSLMLGKEMPPMLQENSLDHFVDIFLHGILSGQQPETTV